MYLVACYCKNLYVIKCTNVALSSAFHVLLMKNANIKEIWIQNPKCLMENLMKGVSLHKLSLLSTQGGTCLPGFPWSATAHSTSLQRVECSFLKYCDSISMVHLTQNCRQLRSFSCRRIGFTDAHFEMFFVKPVGLLNLDISSNNAVTDAGILFIAQKLTSLRTLNIQYCTKLTHQCLAYLAENCTQLEVLYIDVVHADSATAQAVHEFSLKCTSIKYLSIISNFVLCSTTCTSSLIKGCPAMNTLVINKAENICESGRELCKLLKPQLNILTHDESTEYHVLKMPI